LLILTFVSNDSSCHHNGYAGDRSTM
jgi:hypothetical protein